MARTPAASELTVVGSSTEGYESATAAAVHDAARTIRGIRAAEVVSLSALVDEDDVVEYRATVSLSVGG
jgi:flavin-binding protein dodecin